MYWIYIKNMAFRRIVITIDIFRLRLSASLTMTRDKLKQFQWSSTLSSRLFLHIVVLLWSCWSFRITTHHCYWHVGCCLLGRVVICNTNVSNYRHLPATHPQGYQAPTSVLWVGSIVAASAGQMGPSWWKLTTWPIINLRPGKDLIPLICLSRVKGFWWSQDGYSPHSFSLEASWCWE